MNITELATKLYNLACDLDNLDYQETSDKEIKELETALSFIIWNDKYNKGTCHKSLKTLYNCLERIASTN